jgi:hypothetical protein
LDAQFKQINPREIRPNEFRMRDAGQIERFRADEHAATFKIIIAQRSTD